MKRFRIIFEKSKTTFSKNIILSFFGQIFPDVVYAHSLKIIHHDLKHDNVLLTRLKKIKNY
jgi:serine/threonine protein kinase